MDYYKDLYYKLFNKLTDIVKEIQAVQQETEEIFISHGKFTYVDKKCYHETKE